MLLAGRRTHTGATTVFGQVASRWRASLLVGALASAVALPMALNGAPHEPEPAFPVVPSYRAGSGGFSVLTYNVKGLPWPLASGRPAALGRIADRLAWMRKEGRQPQIVVLQEAFTPEAKAIGRRAGYPFFVEGPYTRSAPNPGAAARRVWRLGETQPAVIDSGLVLLSDFPVLSVERVAFAPEDCAGYDCLAAKGVLLVQVQTPDRGPVLIATTHLNCQGASGAPKVRTTRAFARQADFVGRLLARARERGLPIVVAGDFNQGRRVGRMEILRAAMERIAGGPVRDALSLRIAADPQVLVRDRQLAAIRDRARDLQFAFDTPLMRIIPAGIDVPFGTEPGGEMLSDHMGYTVHYRIQPRQTAPQAFVNGAAVSVG